MPSGVHYPLGAQVTTARLDWDPHPLLARLRMHEPVSWVPDLDGWLVTGYDFAVQAMRDPATFTVDDPRFSTARVIGPSMLSLDGSEHDRHRKPFVAPFRSAAVKARFERAAEEEAAAVIDALGPRRGGELRRGFAAPLAATIASHALGVRRSEVPLVLACYEAIVAGVTEITAGAGTGSRGRAAFGRLAERLEAVIESSGRDSLLATAAAGSGLTREQVIANAAVLLFGGIETTEGMIAGVLLHLLERPETLARVRDQPQLLNAAIEESLRLEPAAAVVDRYATRQARLGEADIGAGDLVRISITAANRDPSVFADPDRFDLTREDARRHLAFAQGPHVCVGVHLARLETRIGIAMLLRRLPDLRLDTARPSRTRGLVFRKPPELHALWD